ncbi:MAG: glycosyltransferase family 4 protein [Planctomycetota bacterium]
MSSTLLLAAAFLGGAALSAVATPVWIRLARRQGWLDHPGGRHLHAVAVPRAGGVAIFGGLLGGLLLYGLVRGPEQLLQPLAVPEIRGFLIPCLLVFLVGLLDDIRGLSPRARLLVESIAAVGAMQAGYVIEAVATPWGPLELGFFAFPITLLWLVGVTNAFNLIDGADGLLASTGAAALLGCAAVGLHMDMEGTPALAVAMAGALVGFLPWNWHPAKVFAGDSGSLAVGFTVAAWSLKVSRNPNGAIALHAPLLLCALPIAEATLTLARRYVSGQPFFVGDSSHIHHVLLKKGLGVPRTTAVLAGVSATLAAAAFLSRYWRQHGALASLVFLVVVATLGLRYLRYLELSLLWDRLLQAFRKPRRGLPGVLALVRAGELIRRAPDVAGVAAGLREAVELSRFDYVAMLLGPEGARALAPQPAIEAENELARRFVDRPRGLELVWLFSGPREPAVAMPELELRFPIPLGSGTLGAVVLHHTHDPEAPLPPPRDLHRYLVGPLSEALARLARLPAAAEGGDHDLA